ncbi:MAG: hypothetical protein AB1481_00345 [Candidatus Omnitrophota bacterium]
MLSNLQLLLLEPARAILTQVGQFLINVLFIIVVLIIGWLISKGVKSIITKALRAIKVDEYSDKFELDTLLEKGGIAYSLSELIGAIFYWVGILVTFLLAVNIAGLTEAAQLLNKVVFYIPNVLAAIFILMIAMFVATFLKNIVHAAANNAGLSQSKLLSKIVEVAIMAFAVLIALEQLGIGIRITEITLAIILGSLGLGFALAFGLGCKDLAGKMIEELVDKLKKK